MKLTLRIFADDTNMFYSSKDPEQLQSVVKEELGKVLKFVQQICYPLILKTQIT